MPYYHGGSEDYHYTIDAEDYYCTQTLQLSLLADLPLMANKMSRTPVEHPQALFTIFSEAGMSDELRQKLSGKPVLVLFNKSFYDGSSTFYDNLNLEPARSVHHYAPNIFEQYNMQKIKEMGVWELYKWEI